jgi:hypothetical protein
MNSCKPRVIHESSNIIPIPQKSPTNKKEGFYNVFDPSKSSPPNEFMLKLQLRMSLYESLNKDTNLLNE